MNADATDITRVSAEDDAFVAWLAALTETNNLPSQVGGAVLMTSSAHCSHDLVSETLVAGVRLTSRSSH